MITFFIVGIAAVFAFVNVFCCMKKKDSNEVLMEYLENNMSISEEMTFAV
jgi:hypothetical protein